MARAESSLLEGPRFTWKIELMNNGCWVLGSWARSQWDDGRVFCSEGRGQSHKAMSGWKWHVLLQFWLCESMQEPKCVQEVRRGHSA